MKKNDKFFLRPISSFLVNAIAGVLITLFVFAGSALAAGVFNIGVQLEPPNLDPTSGAAAATDEIVYANIFEGLTRIRDDGSVAPALATKWTASHDARIFDFSLRRDVHFHDGAPFSADDVIFSLTRAGAATSTNAQRAIFEKIEKIEKREEHSIRITLNEPLAEFPTYLGWGDAVIISPTSVDSLADHPIGTGPFQFSAWRRGASVSLARNDDYWGEQAKLDRLVFHFIADPTAAYAALFAGDVDGFPNYPAAENLTLIERQSEFKLIRGTSEGEMIVAINNNIAPLNDIRIRRALNHAIDKNAVIKAGLFGYGTPIGSHFPPHHNAYVDLQNRYPFDPEKARALLAEAGFADGFSLTLSLPPPAYARRGGEIVAAYLEAIGIDVTIRNIEWAQWLSQVFNNKEFELTIVSHTEPLDFDIYARDDYYFGYSNPALESTIEAARGSTDLATRHQLYKDAQQIIADDAVNVFIASSPKIGVWRRDVTGVWANAPVQANDFTKADIPNRAPITSSFEKQTRGFLTAPIFFGGLFVLTALLAWYSRVSVAYLASKLITMVLTLFVATILVFMLLEIAPGDPAQFMLGVNADDTSLAALRQELGVDQPMLKRYTDWIGGLSIGQFGTSYTYRVPVVELIGERLWVTLPLAIFAFALSTLIGVPAGIIGALHKKRPVGKAIVAASQIGIATPNFWLAILLVMFFSIGLNWFSAGGFPGWNAGFGSAIKALILPAIALAVPQAAILAQVMRSSMLNIAQEDFMRTARAKGLSRHDAFFRHGLRNALIPVLTIMGLQFAFLIAGSVIVENVFYLPGLGRLIFQAIAQRDLITVKGVIICLIFIVAFIAFLIDLAYPIVDPRLRRKT